MAFRDVWVGRWNAEGAGIFGMVRVDKSEDLLGCFFFLFFFLFSFRRGVRGNFLEMGFTSGLTSKGEISFDPFRGIVSSFSLEKFGLLFFCILRDKVIIRSDHVEQITLNIV